MHTGQYLTRQDWLAWVAQHVPVISGQEQAQQRSLRALAITEEAMASMFLPLASMVWQRYLQCEMRPWVVGITGCVAVGKSTLARALHALLAIWMGDDRVSYCSTDDFLYPNARLDSLGLSHRKGFPESYDFAAMQACFEAIRSGESVVTPVYSHANYDRIPDKERSIDQPSVLIVEGVNALSWAESQGGIDLGLFLEADLLDVEWWFMRRAERLARTDWVDPSAYFHGLSRLYPEQLRDYLSRVWQDINLENFRQHIVIQKPLADWVIKKNADHSLQAVWLRDV